MAPGNRLCRFLGGQGAGGAGLPKNAGQARVSATFFHGLFFQGALSTRDCRDRGLWCGKMSHAARG